MGSERVTILGELAKAGKGILQEARCQIYGSRPQTPQQRGGIVHNHYHIYPDKKKPSPR